MCPACWTAIIFEGLLWLASTIGLLGIYKWFKIKYYTCICKNCKCTKCKQREKLEKNGN